MSRVKVYTTGRCPFCVKTKEFLSRKGIAFDEVRVDLDRAQLREMLEVTDHARTVPQITIDGRPIGGFDDLIELHMEGGLDELIAEGK